MLSVSAPQRNAAPLAPPALPRRARAPVVTSPVAPRATLSTMEQLQHSRSRSPPLAQLPVGRFNPRLSTDTHFDASSAFFVLSDTTQPFPSAVSSTPTTFSFACATSTQGKIGRFCMHKKGAARFAHRGFFVGDVPFMLSFCASGTNEEKIDLFGRKLDL